MFQLLKSIFSLTRPLSNVKNVLIAFLALFLSKAGGINWLDFIISIASISFITSAVYILNTLCDFNSDRNNKNKRHYSEAVAVLGKNKIIAILTFFVLCGLGLGIIINYYFLLCLVFLLAFNILYSSPPVRLKEKAIFDVLVAGFFVSAIRFIAFWFVFVASFPPLFPILALSFAKSGGYMLYKEMDRNILLKQGIINSITRVRKRTIIIISGIFYVFSIIFAILMCLSDKYFKTEVFGSLPFSFLFIIPLALPPILIIYLKVLDKINIEGKKLRTLGFLYGIVVLVVSLIII